MLQMGSHWAWAKLAGTVVEAQFSALIWWLSNGIPLQLVLEELGLQKRGLTSAFG